jgi:curved DNA-binding protein CbpA
MVDPYEILGLGHDVDEAEVRRRYLELVRQHPPDREPERFAAIREAYERVRDPAVRLEAQLFETATSDSLEAVATDLRRRLRDARISTKTLLALAELP